jgi:hypothetical protein
MIFFLERTSMIELNVGGVKVSNMGKSTEAYNKAIADAGAVLCSNAKNFKKEQMTFIFKLPAKVPLDKVIQEVGKLPDELRGAADWPQ